MVAAWREGKNERGEDGNRKKVGALHDEGRHHNVGEV